MADDSSNPPRSEGDEAAPSVPDDDIPTATRSQQDKERSKQQSRPVNAKDPKGTGSSTKKSTGPSKSAPAKGAPANGATSGAKKSANGAKGGSGSTSGAKKATSNNAKAAPRPSTNRSTKAASQRAGAASRSNARRPPRRSSTSLVTWGIVGLVLVIVAVLVVVKVTQSSPTSASGPTTFTPASATVVDQATNIPASVYNTVGITSSQAPITPPVILTGQPPLVLDGKPGSFYMGGEFCPYCAAERWVLLATFSRFGTFTNLGEMESSTSDIYPGTQTFTFAKADFQSKYLTFQTVERYSNIPDPSTGYYKILQPLTKEQAALVAKYNTSKYEGASGGGGIPFINIGNIALSAENYSPALLAGLSREQIAQNLSDPTNPVTQAIVASSNYLSAAVCKSTGQQPASVCTSKGVTEAAKALKL